MIPNFALIYRIGYLMEECEKALSRSGRRPLSSGKRRMKASDLAQDVNVSRPTGLF